MMAHALERISPELELQAVKEELNLANKTIDRYTHLVTKLYNELDIQRSGICSKCKRKFVPGAEPSTSPDGRSSSTPSPIPLWRLMFGGRLTGSAQPFPKTKATTKQASFKPPLATQLSTFTTVKITPNSPATKPNEVNWSVVHNREVRQTLDVHLAHTLKMKSGVLRVKFSRNGVYLAVGIHTGEIYVYDMKTLSKRIILTIVEYPPKKQPRIFAMQFSPDDKYIATGDTKGQIRVWNLAQRRVVATFKGHRDTVFSVDFSPNGRFLVSGGLGGSVRIWCMRDGSSRNVPHHKRMSFVCCVAVSPDGRYVVAGDDVGILRMWDFRSGQLLQTWMAAGHSQCLWSVVFTSDGKGLLSGGGDMAPRLWDTSSPLVSQYESRRGELVGSEEKESLTFQKHTAGIPCVSIFPDNRRILCGSADPTVRIWDARTGIWECILNGHEKPAMTADASPDGHHLATGCEDGLVRIWRY